MYWQNVAYAHTIVNPKSSVPMSMRNLSLTIAITSGLPALSA